MKKISLMLSMLAYVSAIAGTVYDGESYEYTKGKAPSGAAYVMPSNVVSVADKRVTAWWQDSRNNGVRQEISDISLSATEPRETEIGISNVVHSAVEPIGLKAGATYTFIPTNDIGAASHEIVSTMYVGMENPNSLRNFDIYIPNEANIIAALPMRLEFDKLPAGTKYVYAGGNPTILKLPVKVSIKQPYSKLVIGEITEYDDGTNWAPDITNVVARWTGFNFDAHLYGTNLQGGVEAKFVYPVTYLSEVNGGLPTGGSTMSGGTGGSTSGSEGLLSTNDVIKFDEYGYASGACYNRAHFTFTPEVTDNIKTDESGNMLFTILYRTGPGGTNTCERTVNINILND